MVNTLIKFTAQLALIRPNRPYQKAGGHILRSQAPDNCFRLAALCVS